MVVKILPSIFFLCVCVVDTHRINLALLDPVLL